MTGDHGETVTQLVLLTPVLLVLVMTVVQVSLLWHAAHLADAAASRAAVTAARLDAGPADGAAAAATFASSAGARLAAPPAVSRRASLASATVVVEVPHLLPLFPSTVRRTSVATVEQFRPEPSR